MSYVKNEFVQSLGFLRLVSILTILDFKRKYRRSLIGAFWGTLSILLTVIVVSVVFGSNIFGGARNSFLYVSTGMIVWNFISVSIAESCDTFILNESVIRQIRIPFFVYNFRVVSRNFVFFLHNLLVIAVAYLIDPFYIGFEMLWAIPAIILISINLVFICTTISIIATRFRDFGQFVTNGLPLVFYATPILWSIESVKFSKEIIAFLQMNPMLYIIDIFRNPVMGTGLVYMDWFVALICTLFNFTISILIYEKYKNRIAYWI